MFGICAGQISAMPDTEAVTSWGVPFLVLHLIKIENKEKLTHAQDPGSVKQQSCLAVAVSREVEARNAAAGQQSS